MVILMVNLVLASLSEEIDTTEIVGTDLPRFAKGLFGNAKINLYITLEDGTTENYGIVTQNGVVTSLADEELNNPSLNVYTTESIVRNLIQSDNAVASLQEALNSGGITYRAVGLINKIRFGFVSMVLKLFNSGRDSSLPVTGSVVAENMEGIDHPEEVEEDVSAAIETNYLEHLVKLTNDGFIPAAIKIKSGDKVVWKNERSAKAMIVGTRKCRDVKSKIFGSGESYEYTFIEKSRCDIVDGIMTQKASVVYVE